MPSEPDNAKLAENVLGWKWQVSNIYPADDMARHVFGGAPLPKGVPGGYWKLPNGQWAYELPDFATDIAAAVGAIETLRLRGMRWSIACDEVDCDCFLKDQEENGWTGIAHAPAAAITAAVWAWLQSKETSDG